MMNKALLLLVALGLNLHLAVAAERIDLSSLPAAVQQTIQERKGEGEVKKVRTLRNGNSVRYVVDYKEGGDEKQIQVAADGSVIDEELDAPREKKGKGYAKGKGKGKGKGQDKEKWTKESDDKDLEQEKAERKPKAETPSKDETSSDVAKLSADLSQRVQRINQLEKNPAAEKAGLAAVAVETGVRLSVLQSQSSEYGIGIGGLLVCHEISKRTGKSATTYIKQRLQKRDWNRIAEETKVDLSPMLPKLDRVQQKMAAAQQQKKR